MENETKEKWTIYSKETNKEKSLIIRYIKYFLFTWKIFMNRKKMKKIVAWQQFYGIIYAFYSRFFNVKKSNELYICTFIFKEKNKLRNIYFKFIKYSISSIYVDKIICFSKNECEYYSKIFNISIKKFINLKLGIEKIESINEDNKGKYIFAPGNSNRDYEFLIKTLENTKYKLKILGTVKNKKKVNNIEILNNIYGNEYYKLLKNSYCIVIPLIDEKISSGQLVILQAMQLGKPIIITENNSINDYILNNYNGIIIKKDPDKLIEVLEKVYNDKNFYNKLVFNGKKEYENNYSLEVLGKNIGKLILKEDEI